MQVLFRELIEFINKVDEKNEDLINDLDNASLILIKEAGFYSSKAEFIEKLMIQEINSDDDDDGGKLPSVLSQSVPSPSVSSQSISSQSESRQSISSRSVSSLSIPSQSIPSPSESSEYPSNNRSAYKFEFER